MDKFDTGFLLRCEVCDKLLSEDELNMLDADGDQLCSTCFKWIHEAMDEMDRLLKKKQGE